MLLPLTYAAALLLPAYLFFHARGGFGFLAGSDSATFARKLFPLVGLLAFSLLWVQLLVGTNRQYLRQVYPWMMRFHRWQGGFVLLFALLHPTLLLIGVGTAHYLARDFVAPNLVVWVWVGYLQLLLLVCTAGSALLLRVPWLRTRWRTVHYANYGVFVLVWSHSWFLGSDVRTTDLRYLWTFFGATVVLSSVFRFLRRRFAFPVVRSSDGPAGSDRGLA